MAPPHYAVHSAGPKPLHFRALTLSRLSQFLSSAYPSITSILTVARTDKAENIKIGYWPSGAPQVRVPFSEAIKQRFRPFHKGDDVGPSWTQHWFRVQITLPTATEWTDAERVTLEWDQSAESLIFDTEGRPLQGITGGFGGDRRVDFILTPEMRRAGSFTIYIATCANGMFGVGAPDTNSPPDLDRTFRLESADLCIPRMEAWRLFWDFITISDLAHRLPESSPLGNRCLEVGNAICNAFLSTDLSTIAVCRKMAEKVFGQGWEELGGDIFAGKPSDSSCWAIGNCHIDNAWLWTFTQTRDKAARSWSTQLDLMERYPEYRFVASQAQQFAYVEEDYPLLFERIRAKAASGQFQPIGGCWVEMDTNMPSGEALCRQFLFGQRYFKSRFGSYSSTFWLPDTFGFSGQLPQLCRLAGMSNFFSQKLSWNQFNKPDHSTFNWCGIDGTQVLSHFTPVNTYTAQASVEDVINSLGNHRSLQSGAATGLLAFGNGDGGGGPLAPMIENLRRCRAVADTSGELPKVTMGSSVADFYDDILAKTEGGTTLATHNGELYFELHRGTATSHGSIKFGNRKSEILLREIEFAATLASVGAALGTAGKGGKGHDYLYPKDQLDRLWEGVLTNQFHDILPGSSIGMVYVDAEAVYADVREKGSALLEQALRVLVPHSVPVYSAIDRSVDTEDQRIIAINTTPFPRRELALVPVAMAKLLDEEIVQVSHDGQAYVMIENVEGGVVARATTTKEFVASGRGSARAQLVGKEIVLSNDSLKIVISPEGRLSSIVDVALSRELLAKGKTSGFVIFQDRPLNWDAWDVDAFHLETKTEVNASSMRVVEDGPLRATVEIVYHTGQSTIRAFVSLDAFSSIPKQGDLSALRFDVNVDWHERHRFLKYELPLEISAENATYETQFGFASRPTIRNTTYDRAKFEVVGHKFADLSEFGYGVAILNDCKYGYSTEGSVMRISLLRAPTAPDAESDQGKHIFSFAITPHRGCFAESSIPQAAILFNNPSHIRRIAAPSHAAPALAQLVSSPKVFALVGDRNVLLETIKRGEDDHFGPDSRWNGEKRHVILRIYEAYGGHGVVKLLSSLPVESIEIVDILERPVADVGQLEVLRKGERSEVVLKLKGFEILTVRVTLA